MTDGSMVRRSVGRVAGLVVGLVVGLGVGGCAEERQEAPLPSQAASAAGAEVGPGAAGEAERPVVYVDVRRPDEWAAGRVEGAIHIPHTEMGERWPELEAHRDSDIVLYCRTGRRSGIAEDILRQAGFERLHNGGGLHDLERRGVPVAR